MKGSPRSQLSLQVQGDGPDEGGKSGLGKDSNIEFNREFPESNGGIGNVEKNNLYTKEELARERSQRMLAQEREQYMRFMLEQQRYISL